MVQIGLYYNIDSGEFSWYSDEIPKTSNQRVTNTPETSPEKNYVNKEEKRLKIQQRIQELEDEKEILELKQCINALKRLL